MAWSPFDKPIIDGSATRFAVPAPWFQTSTGMCRSCGSPVAWAEHPSTAGRAPFDTDGKNHMATCPHSDMWEGKSRRRGGRMR